MVSEAHKLISIYFDPDSVTFKIVPLIIAVKLFTPRYICQFTLSGLITQKQKRQRETAETNFLSFSMRFTQNGV